MAGLGTVQIPAAECLTLFFQSFTCNFENRALFLKLFTQSTEHHTPFGKLLDCLQNDIFTHCKTQRTQRNQ